MHRFFLSPDQCQSDTPVLEGREAHHALHVLRLNAGAPVEILDGVGNRLTGLVSQCDRRSLSLEIQNRQFTPRPGMSAILCQAILKPKAMEWVLQKTTELGVTRIVLLSTRHSVARVEEGSSKMEKWRWITIDALKQSGGAWLPTLKPPTSLETFLQSSDLPDLSLVASLKSDRPPRKLFQEYLNEHQGPPRSVGLWIGPEGDFTTEEMEHLQEKGVREMTLGPRTLRSETAALYCLSLINYEFGE